MILHDAYDTLRRLGLVANHATFSTAYLNKAPRHFDDLICSQRAPGVAALLSLHMRMQAIANAFASNPSTAMLAEELDGIARRIWLELERRCCSLLPSRKHRPTSIGAATRPRGAAASGLTSTARGYRADRLDAQAGQPDLQS